MAREGSEKGGDANPAFVDLKKLAGAVKNRQDSIESLSEDVMLLAETTAGLTAEVRLVDARRKRDLRRNVALFAMLSLIMMIIGVGVVALLSFSSTNRSILKEIRSCTTPTGECSKRGLSQQQKAVAQLNQLTIYAAECAVQNAQHPTDAAIESCIRAKLAEK